MNNFKVENLFDLIKEVHHLSFKFVLWPEIGSPLGIYFLFYIELGPEYLDWKNFKELNEFRFRRSKEDAFE